jgi:hypothetical protein
MYLLLTSNCIKDMLAQQAVRSAVENQEWRGGFASYICISAKFQSLRFSNYPLILSFYYDKRLRVGR